MCFLKDIGKTWLPDKYMDPWEKKSDVVDKHLKEREQINEDKKRKEVREQSDNPNYMNTRYPF